MQGSIQHAIRILFWQDHEVDAISLGDDFRGK